MSDGVLVRYAVERAVATLTLDSPANRNALSRALVAQLRERLAEAAADEGVRAIVLTHDGRTFCSGADLTEARAGSMEQGARDLIDLFGVILELPKPVVSRIDGHVRAGGMGLVAACDIALAGPASTFALTEARLGLAPAAVSVVLRPRLTDRGFTRHSLTAGVFDAAEAVAIGLITEAPADLDTALESILDDLRAGSPQGLRESKAVATLATRQSLADHRDDMAALSARLFGSEEAAEGMAAAQERRPPRWAVD